MPPKCWTYHSWVPKKRELKECDVCMYKGVYVFVYVFVVEGGNSIICN